MSNHRPARLLRTAILALVATAIVAAPALAAPPKDDFASAASLGSVLSIGTSVDLAGAPVTA
jgi:hypothetical protein